MSTTIDIENAKQIREPMVISGSISAPDGNALTYTTGGDVLLYDSVGYADMGIPMRRITDLQGDGFPLDGSVSLYDPTLTMSAENGKFGLRTEIGQGMTVSITSSNEITALTINKTSGTGSVSYNGISYQLAEMTVIPVQSQTSALLTFTNTSPTERLEIASIVSGVSLLFDNDNIISCELNLRSNLSPTDPSWEVSEIQYRVYYPYDISQAVTAISEDVPITYSAGYEGDMSPMRRFYVTGSVTQERGIIAIKGVDASDRLNKKFNAYENGVLVKERAARLYTFMKVGIANAGITLQNYEAPPTVTSTETGSHYLLIPGDDWKAYLVYMMNSMHDSTTTTNWARSIGRKRYWPRFVDAGIPSLAWSYPATRWTIREEDCGDIVNEYEQQINSVTYSLNRTHVQSASAQQNVATTVKTTPGSTYTVDLGGYFLNLHITNCRKVLAVTMQTVKFIASGKESVIRGRQIWTNENEEERTFTAPRSGISHEVEYIFNAADLVDNTVLKNSILQRSPHIGSFTWHGDPRMQPRDVFNFVKRDGSTVLCTIESIDLTHEAGGTKAKITYREGVV